ncbi:hypothetical protein PBV87_12885 [Niameybacter massiliensis]|uniref:Prophage minor tail protein Z (GPZ) n=1 Tax=Holtiella tumoricola TaxID=3018743 RepID=A0AA42DNM7_9FIRM|nr:MULTISPECIES: hypothetical protein [Lachnospirales]MDA3732384.1 hypothetical protein [Holtiella tumoricola]
MGKGSVWIDTKEIDLLSLELKSFPKQTQTAIYHALKRSLDQTKTEIGRIVPKEYAIKQKEIKKSFIGGVNYPTKSNLKASLTSKGKLLSFAHFPFTPKTAIRKGKRAVVKVTIKKNSPKVPSKVGFTATTGAKGEDKVQFNVFRRIGVFKKSTRGRYAEKGYKREMIAPIRTLSIPQMITSEGMEKRIQDFALEKFEQRLEHETQRALEKIQSKVKGAN